MIALKDIYLFKDISMEFINLIIDNSRRIEVTANERILEQGDESNEEAYIIQEGSASVFIDGEFVKNLTAPDIFGEIALVTDESRTASIQANSDMILLKINKTLLHKILKEFPNGNHIQEVMRERIMENLRR